MDIIDCIIDLFLKHSYADFIGNGECEVFIDDERRFREKLEKIFKKNSYRGYLL